MKVTYIDHMGTDLSVVNAARVSFGKKSEWVRETYYANDFDAYPSVRETLSDKDKSLIHFLARGCTTGDWENLIYDLSETYTMSETEELLRYVKRMPTHWTPFGHTGITLHIKAPIFVARQLGKHQVGMVWNEVSRRYVDETPEFYVPEVWRKRADNVKQGSSDEAVKDALVSDYGLFMDELVDIYDGFLRAGVCPEQARMVLPQSMYTEWYWTGNLYSFANVYNQRTDSHAQKETQEIARQIGEIIEPLFPVSWAALTK